MGKDLQAYKLSFKYNKWYSLILMTLRRITCPYAGNVNESKKYPNQLPQHKLNWNINLSN
jgi:hypothetical protein